jgi:Rrf2 family protein
MQLTMTGEYALRAMLYICSYPMGTFFQISDIAIKNDIPDNFLRKIIPRLCKAGILRSQRGTSGGVSLLKHSKEITPLHVIETVEGEMALNKCLIGSDFCSKERWCSVHILWCETQQKIKEMLSGKTFEELAKTNSERFLHFHSHKQNNKSQKKSKNNKE